jgi:hypothetical protein
VRVGAGELAEHKPIKPIRLSARGAKPVACGLDLIGMQRQHAHPSFQQPVDPQSIGPLDRHQLDVKARQRRAQAADPILIMRKRRREQLLAG